MLERDFLDIRDMSSDDLEQVLIIERNAHISPWARLSFDESLTKNYSCRVIEDGAAAPQYQGIGLGHMLMQEIMDIAQSSGLKKVFLEVRASNDIAQSLYSKWQFNQIAIRKRYYSLVDSTNTNQREDALVFLRQL